jgi:hypothetical protein
MTLSAIISLVVVWTIIAGATIFCFGKLLTSPRRFDSSSD